MPRCAKLMRKWAKFGAFHGCQALYVQVPLLHISRKTPLQSYTSGYSEAIAQWAVRISPRLQLTDVKNKLSNVKRKNFLAYHHFNPSLFETLKKWGSAKKFSDKYRCDGETFFGQDFFSHHSKRCCGLHTEECYLLPSYKEFEQEISRAVEKKGKIEGKRVAVTEKGNDAHTLADKVTARTNFGDCLISIGKKKVAALLSNTGRLCCLSKKSPNLSSPSDGLIALTSQQDAESEYTINKKGRKICKKIIQVKLGRVGTHLARRVMEKGANRWYMEYRQVEIQWDSNSQFEWVNEYQIEVSEGGKGSVKQ